MRNYFKRWQEDVLEASWNSNNYVAILKRNNRMVEKNQQAWINLKNAAPIDYKAITGTAPPKEQN